MVQNKIKGGLFGVAIGDALGVTTEFMTANEIKVVYGEVRDMIGRGVWNLPPGETTDDTAMTIAVGKGIVENPQNPIEAIGREFLNWYETKPKSIGATIRSVFDSFRGDWFEAAKEVCRKFHGKCGGNGTLMRTLPVAFAYPKEEEMLKWTELQSKMTHDDQKAAEICKMYNKMAHQLLNGKPLKKVIEEQIDGTEFETIKHEKPTVPPDGYVVHTFYWVLYFLYHFDDFKEVAINAINNGGDSDTIGAIACGLKGVEIGYDRLPKEFKHKIRKKEELTELAENLTDVRALFLQEGKN